MFSLADTMDKIENTSHLFGEFRDQLLNILCVAEFISNIYIVLLTWLYQNINGPLLPVLWVVADQDKMP